MQVLGEGFAADTQPAQGGLNHGWLSPCHAVLAFLRAAHRFFIIAEIRLRAAGLMVLRAWVFVGVGFAACLRLAAHRAFIIADNLRRPAGVRPRFLACFGVALATTAVALDVAVAVPSSDSSAAMAWSIRLRSAFRSVRIGLISICLLPANSNECYTFGAIFEVT